METATRNRFTFLAIGLLVGLALLVGSSPQRAEAHTTVKSATANGKVLRITFNGPIRRGSIKATNSRGKVVSRGSGGRDPRNVKRLVVPLKNVGRGVYRAKWSMIAIDGHRQSGSLRFRVR